MERINRSTVTAVIGEIIEHEDLFSVPYGFAARIPQQIGLKGILESNVGAICIHHKTGTLEEASVGYSVGDNMSVLLGNVFEIITSTQPYAKKGDEGVVEYLLTKAGATECATFMGLDNKDPNTGKMQRAMVVNPETGKWEVGEKPLYPRPDGGLNPVTDYYTTIRRANRATGALLPFRVGYFATDDLERDDEIPVGTVVPAPAISAPVIIEGEELAEAQAFPVQGVGTILFVPK